MEKSIAIITGSTLGGAEYVADHLAELLENRGFSVQVENNAAFADVAEQNLWLIVTSTHGAGDLPDNLKPFIRQINTEDLTQVRFAVVGLGNSDYDTFCHAVDKVENALTAQGAARLCDSLRIDVLTTDDHEQCAENWLPNFVAAL
ncbi:FMN-binding protein MioC [Basfia succiniciproducens]|uniref:MioC protein n=1 Tax=Basfia succiniciproducens TaxID=653940 RepID=A0A1G5D901_9PAST|nr:FMN-binding protein MioC [Basfia succiniciproducens]QIM69374.1 FMN-binding protein MioC [Basfia succiniciproducens]SCY10991.1 MioC protein [Basfia succiniciproducens]